jgi:putative DNA primase/helicase
MSYANYFDVLRQMRQAGLVVDELDVGRLMRCRVEGDRERRGWYSLHELRLTGGDLVLVGSFGVWRGAEQNSQKVELGAMQKLTEDQRTALRDRIRADRLQAAEDRRRLGRQAADRARAMWAKLSPTGDSPYLARKGVGAHGVRFSAGTGAMVIPMLDVQGRIHGLQVLHQDKRRGRDKDFWPPGAVKQGHFFQLGPVPTDVALIAEGYATAASVFEATGYPTFVAFDAGNLLPVAQAVRGRYPRLKVLVCADDDYLTEGNPGCEKAAAAAMAVQGQWLAPTFASDRAGAKITDFNDLHQLEGLHVVRQQVEAFLRHLGWLRAPDAGATRSGGAGSGDERDGRLKPIETVDELLERYSLVYEAEGLVFDHWEHRMVPLGAMRNACLRREIHRAWMESPARRMVRLAEVGFDPTGRDPDVLCNLWAGWPTTPKEGECCQLLELLWFMCSAESANADALYDWVLKWLAYPLQHPGAKMQTALIVHGPQGTGKNMFFEAYMTIFGSYGRIVDQSAVEDKFNDWASRKLFLIADEVVARMDLYHVKNKLKSFITGEWIRINPKGMPAYDERNHVNMVVLSNEALPAALESDDRRHAVIWTPDKLDEPFYRQVRAEIEVGGSAALHDHLLRLDLGDHKPWTKPPMTAAKADLIAMGMDSSERFWIDWMEGDLDLPRTIARTEDLYSAYRWWCTRNGVSKPAQASTFIGATTKRRGATKTRVRHQVWHGVSPRIVQSTVIVPPKAPRPDDLQGVSEALDAFGKAVRRYRDVRAMEGEMA